MVRKHKLGQKKVALFPEIGQVKNFLSPTHPHNKSKLKIKKNCTSQFICANLCFFSLQTRTDRALCLTTKKIIAVRVVF